MPFKLTQNISKKFPKFERYISLPLILIFTIPPIFLVGFGGIIGSYIGMGMFIFIGGYTMYEVFKNMNMSKYSAIYLSFSILILFFLPWTSWPGVYKIGIKQVAETNAFTNSLGYLFTALFSWKTTIIYLIAILLPIIMDPKLRQKETIIQNTLIIIVVSFIIGFFAKGIWIINKYEWTWVFFFVSIAIISDTFGFFGGMLFGKKWFKGAKLAPKLSPKKTWAGFVVGYVFTAAFISISGWYMHIFQNTSSEIAFLIIAALIVPVCSVIGDLLFSGIKRFLGIKDFSNLLPGHGGAADRLDAMATVLFTFVILFTIF